MTINNALNNTFSLASKQHHISENVSTNSHLMKKITKKLENLDEEEDDDEYEIMKVQGSNIHFHLF
jgi:hypothetical protein